MYAATGYDYVAHPEDLPDEITYQGGPLSRIGTDYGDDTDGVLLESGKWAVYADGVRTEKDCLIDGDGNLTPGDDPVEDTFPGTLKLVGFQRPVEVYCDGHPWYTNIFLGDLIPDTLVYRESLCVWRGSGSFSFEIPICDVYPYVMETYTTTYEVTLTYYLFHWVVLLTVAEDPSGTITGSGREVIFLNFDNWVKDGPQNSPVGAWLSEPRQGISYNASVEAV